MQGLDYVDPMSVIRVDFNQDSSETSYFKIFTPDDAFLWESQFILSCIPILKALPKFISDNRKKNKGDLQEMVKIFRKRLMLVNECLSQIELFLQNKQKSSVTLGKYYGRVDKIRQKFVKELSIFDILAHTLDNVFVDEFALNKLPKFSKSETFRRFTDIEDDSSLHHNISTLQFVELTKMVKKIYSVIGIACKENIENQMYVVKYFSIFQKHAGYELGATHCMSIILQDNEAVLLNLQRG